MELPPCGPLQCKGLAGCAELLHVILERLREAVSMQERTGLPSICTVQAPHWALPQPNFVPVMPRMSRRTQSSGMPVGASNDFYSPLIVNFNTEHRFQVGLQTSDRLRLQLKLQHNYSSTLTRNRIVVGR
jgi:hypothetical protein